jgi:hypothetical protein
VSSPPSGDLSFLYFRMFWLFIGMALWNDGRHSGLICVCTCTIYSGWLGWDGVFIQFCSDLSTFLDERGARSQTGGHACQVYVNIPTILKSPTV